MHQAHEDGHAAQDDWSSTSPGHGDYGYNRPYGGSPYDDYRR